MKEKNIRKIADYIVEIVRKENVKAEPPRQLARFLSKSNSEQVIEYCEIDEKNSKKFIKFVTSLLSQKSGITLDIQENQILICCEIQGQKPKVNTGRAPTNYDKDFEIKIDENGFRFRRDRGNYYNFADKDILGKLKPLILEKNQELSNTYLNQTIDELVVELNLSRENNLEEILS